MNTFYSHAANYKKEKIGEEKKKRKMKTMFLQIQRISKEINLVFDLFFSSVSNKTVVVIPNDEDAGL